MRKANAWYRYERSEHWDEGKHHRDNPEEIDSCYCPFLTLLLVLELVPCAILLAILLTGCSDAPEPTPSD